MARIIGTPQVDHIVGTYGDDLIRGRAGDDQLDGNRGDDRIYGDAGDDYIQDLDGRSEIRGGSGNETIFFSRGHAYGGAGDDQIGVFGGGWAIGGKGDDVVYGTGALWGDEGPGTPERVAGNDGLTIIADLDSARGHGGLGNDKFFVELDSAQDLDIGIVDDFRHGEDRLQVYVAPGGNEPPYDLFTRLDANHNGVLEWSDSLSGGQVWVDIASDTMFLGFGNARVVVHGATELTQSDWLV